MAEDMSAAGSLTDEEIGEEAAVAAAAAAGDLDTYLEKYMGRRAEAEESGRGLSVYEELRQKERDLLLAAELGRALLCSNAQLKADGERIRGDLEGRLAQLEREKCDLRAKLDSTELEWDAQMRDLQAETRALREELRRQQLSRSELSSANDRLAEECRRSAERVAELQCELRARRAEAQDRLARASAEAGDLLAERADLERRLGLVAAEADAASAASAEQRAQLEARAGELADTVAELRERLAASVASQRRQQMEFAEEQLFQQHHQQQHQLMSPATPNSLTGSCGRQLQFQQQQQFLASPGSVDENSMGESLFSELAGHQQHLQGAEAYEDIEEDEAEARPMQYLDRDEMSALGETATDTDDAGDESADDSEDSDCRRRRRRRPGSAWGADASRYEIESLSQLVLSLQAELDDKCRELQQTKAELSCQQRQNEVLLSSESSMRRDRLEAAEKRINLESQLGRMKAEVDRLNSELGCSGAPS